MSTAALIRSEPMSDPFSARSIAALRAEVAAILDQPQDVRLDAIRAIGARSAMRLVCAALGVPRRDWAMFSRWAWLGDDDARASLGAYVDVMVADRCYRQADDLLTDLVVADVDVDGLTCDDLRALVVALVAA